MDERILGSQRRIVILDYKTGEYTLPRKNLNRDCLNSRQEIKKQIGSFQLPIYIYIFAEFKKISSSGIGASFYSLREIKEEFLSGNEDTGDSLEPYLKAAKKIISEIICPDFDFVRDDSNEYYCRFCPFSSLCKR